MNIDQLRLSVSQIEEMLGLAQEWLEQLHHLADHADQDASVELAQVTVMLGEARAKLESAVDMLDEDDHDHGVVVEKIS